MQETAGSVFDFLSTLHLGETQCFENLSLAPLQARSSQEPAYLRFDQAIETGDFSVTEVSDAGSVPELRVTNALGAPVLMLNGDELVGAKQNRVLNVTVLVPAKSSITVPVSCVEQGRWSERSSEFRDSKETLFAEARASKMAQVNESMAAGVGRRSAQGEVWGAIAAKQGRMDAPSPTGAVDSIYGRHRPQLERFQAAFTAKAGEVGAVFAIDGRPIGCELFDASSTYAGYLPRLVRSYALDAMEAETSLSAVPSRQALEGFLGDIAHTDPSVYAAVGLGQEVRLQRPELVGAALVVDSALVHLCAFSTRRATRRRGPSARSL